MNFFNLWALIGMWVWPQVPLGRPLPEHCKKHQGGGCVGGKRDGEGGREGLWLEGRVLQLQGRAGGDLPKGSWGRTHIWGSRS